MTKAEIQFVRSLADKRVRDEERLFIAEGDKLISEIVASGWKIRNLYAIEGHFDGRAEIISSKEMERISQLKTASTSLAVVEQPHHSTPVSAPSDRLSLALDGVQNPGNLGTIIRLADWFGISDIYCSADTADCYNPKVVQATMGAILRVKVHYLQLADFLKKTAANKTPVDGTMLNGENIYQSERTPAGGSVMGNARAPRLRIAQCGNGYGNCLLGVPTQNALMQAHDNKFQHRTAFSGRFFIPPTSILALRS